MELTSIILIILVFGLFIAWAISLRLKKITVPESKKTIYKHPLLVKLFLFFIFMLYIETQYFFETRNIIGGLIGYTLSCMILIVIIVRDFKKKLFSPRTTTNISRRNQLIGKIFAFVFLAMGVFASVYFYSTQIKILDENYNTPVNQSLDTPHALEPHSRIFASGGYLYIISDFYHSVDIYDFNGTFLRSYIFPIDGKEVSIVWYYEGDLYVSIQDETVIYQYCEGVYSGRLEYVETDLSFGVTTFDSSGESQIGFTNFYPSRIVLGFDTEYIYSTNNIGTDFHTDNETTSETLELPVSELINRLYVFKFSHFEDDTYSIERYAIVKNQEILFETNYMDYTFAQPRITYLILLTAFGMMESITGNIEKYTDLEKDDEPITY